MSKYTHITEEAMHEFMTENGFTLGRKRAGAENIYTMAWHGGKYLLTVFSSCVPGEGSRQNGADAIRVVLKSVRGPVWKDRLFRVAGWKKNLKASIELGT